MKITIDTHTGKIVIEGDDIHVEKAEEINTIEELKSLDLSGFKLVTAIGDAFLYACDSLKSLELSPKDTIGYKTLIKQEKVREVCECM